MFSPHLSRSFILYACMLSPRLSGSLNLYFRLRGLAFSAPHMYLAFANDFHMYPTVLSNCCGRIYKPVLRNKLASIKKKKKKVFLLSPNYDLCRCVVIAQRGLTDSNTHAKHVEPDCAMPARCQ